MAEKPKSTGKFGKGNPGKPVGAVNKTTIAAKEAIAMAAEGLGGVNRLIDWAKEDPLNERAFWAGIYPKLIPVTLAGEKNAPLVLRLERVLVDPKREPQS
jgi:hypothetical protein